MNKLKTTNKKSIQLSQAFGAVLTLVLVATLVIIAIVIFVNLASGFAGTLSVAKNNESTVVAVTDIAPYTVQGASNCSFGGFAVTEILNATSVNVVPTNNFTVGTAGTITMIGGQYNDTIMNVSYTYTWGSDACTASENMTTEFAAYTSLIGLVGTIIFLGLVIGVLVASFAFGGRRDN